MKIVGLDSANNYEHPDQKINHADVVAVIYSPSTPEAAGMLPSRVGEAWVQFSEGTGGKARMWISVAQTPTKAVWEEVTMTSPDLVLRNQENDFHKIKQTIQGRQILTFIDGGEQNPGDAAERPEYDGQFFIATKKKADGTWDGALWVARGNTWVPIVSSNGGETPDLTSLTRRVEDLETRGDEFDALLRGIRDDITDVQGRVLTLEDWKTATDVDMDEVEDRLVAVEAYDNRILKNREDIGNLQRDLGLVADRVDEHEIELDNMDTRVTDLEAGGGHDCGYDPVDYAHQKDLIQQNLTSCASLTTQVESNDGDITMLRADITQLEADDGEQQTQLDEHQTDIISNTRRILALETHTLDVAEDGTINGSKFDGHDARIVYATEKAEAAHTQAVSNSQKFIRIERDITSLENKDVSLRGLIDDNATDILTIQQGITAMGAEWTTKFEEVEATAADALGTANNVSGRMNTAEAEIDTAQTDITTLQNSLTATGGDITNLSGRVGPLETDMVTVKGQTTSLDTRVDALEAIEHPTHPDLPPLVGNAGRYLIINDEENAFEASTFTNTQAEQMLAFGGGCQTGDSLVNLKCQGGDTALTSGDIDQNYFSSGNVVMGTPAAGQTKTVTMGVIQAYTRNNLEAWEVREGCIMTVANLGSGTMNLVAPAGHKIKSGTQENWVEYSLPAGRTVTLFPAIYDSAAKQYIVLSDVCNRWGGVMPS